MSKITHTKGPWRLPTKEEAARWGAPYLILDSEGGSLADATPGFPMSEEEEQANARLMAASPDYKLLLQGLLSGVIRWEPFGEWDSGKGELCIGGLRYTTGTDEHGIPRLDSHTRAALSEAIKRRG